MGLEHKVYGYVSEKVFFDMLNEAKRADVHTDANKRVDIGSLVADLVTAFSEGRYPVIKEKHDAKKKEAPAFSYLSAQLNPAEETKEEKEIGDLQVTIVPEEKTKRSHKKKEPPEPALETS